MPLKIIDSFDVYHLSILDENGNIDKKLMPKISEKEIFSLYEFMLLTRIFDDKALKLQRQGRLGTYASMLGQEATIIGSSYALEKKDWMFPSFRESGAYLLRGLSPEKLFMYWGGDERGMFIPKDQNNFPVCIPVATQTLHAVGAAMASNIKNEKTAFLTYFGDGATSEGDFHEAMNFAGVFNAPVVFICQNNQFAISVPRENQTKSKTIAQKAIAYGFQGIQVDGNDVFAVYKATKDALHKARAKKGPTLIECFTYRIGDHTTADDSSKYRAKKELEYWQKKDPILRLRKYMQKNNLWSKNYEDKITKKFTDLIENSVKKYESVKPQDKEEIFKYAYSSMPKKLKEQSDYLKEVGE
nr:pyruvate dehydrogenase (acetyl-transferring) E1 component subunit alpha [Candidatus Woesearchaeota archaeon]